MLVLAPPPWVLRHCPPLLIAILLHAGDVQTAGALTKDRACARRVRAEGHLLV